MTESIETLMNEISGRIELLESSLPRRVDAMVSPDSKLPFKALLYRAALIGQFGFYLVSLLAGYLPPRPKPFKLLRLTTMFSGMNLALLVGFWRWVRGTQKGTWRPTGRHGQRA